MRNGWISRVLSWVAAALIGGVFGLAGTIAHSFAWGVLPIGLIIGTVACASILVAIRSLSHDRAAAVAAGVGMIITVLVISGEGPGGSVVVPDSLSGRVWTYLVAGAVLMVIAWPSMSRLPVRTVAPSETGASRPREVATIAESDAVPQPPALEDRSGRDT